MGNLNLTGYPKRSKEVLTHPHGRGFSTPPKITKRSTQPPRNTDKVSLVSIKSSYPDTPARIFWSSGANLRTFFRSPMAVLYLVLASTLSFIMVSLGQEPTPRVIEVRFVPSGSQGTVGLGIYNPSGKLIRVLSSEWTFDRFRLGFDGISTIWDGLDEAGEAVPEGSYSARGFIVGDIKITGEAFHFNDWVESPNSPRPAEITGQQILAGGDILLAVQWAEARVGLVRYSPEIKVRWHTMTPQPEPLETTMVSLATSDTLALIAQANRLIAVRLSDGVEVDLPLKLREIKAVAARGNRLAVLDAEGLRFWQLPHFTQEGQAKDLPPNIISIALLEEGVIAALRDGSVWRWQDEWTLLPILPGIVVQSVSSGQGQTFWALEEEDGSPRVTQYSFEEGRLAEWTPPPQDGQLTAVAGARESDYFIASLTAPGAQRTVGIRRREGSGGWEYVFDKTITQCTDFGEKDGQLQPATGNRPEDISVSLGSNLLDLRAGQILALRATADEDGTGLSTRDGLPLLHISEQAGPSQVMLLSGAKPGTARFFQGDGTCVEEYLIANLADMTSFDAGTIEMGPDGETEPEPAHEAH